MIKLYGRIQPKRLFGEVKINYGAFNGKLQAKTVAPSQEDFIVFPDSGFKGLSHVVVEAATLQEKTIKPSGIEQTVVPDVGVYGLSKVIVEAQGNHGLLEDKTVSPSETEQILTPGEGYYGIQSVTVKAAPLEEKTATSTDQDQTLTPSEGFYGMDQVTVKGIPNAEDYTFSEVATFPAIPADYLAPFPYAGVLETMVGGVTTYVLAVSGSAFFYATSGGDRGLGTAGAGAMYQATVGATAWAKTIDFTAGNGVRVLSDSDLLVWTNHDVTDVNEGFTYFAKSDVHPAATAEVYRIQKETADDIGREINRLWKTAEPMTAERMKKKLEDLDIELTELTVYPTDEVQEITPDGYYGFSKIIVEAVEDSGGTGGGSGEDDDKPTGGAAENTTFGDEYGEEKAPTGNYDYSGGTDENPSYIPEIPGGEYQALFCKKLKAGQAFRFTYGADSYDLETTSDAMVYAAAGWCLEDEGTSRRTITRVLVYSGSESARYRIKKTSAISWGGYESTNVTDYGYYGVALWRLNIQRESWGSDLSVPPTYVNISGIPFHDVDSHADAEGIINAMYACATSGGDSGKDQFIAFGSATQILYDGSSINNADNSPMTIYECNASNKNTWVEVGSTDGSDYPVGGYTLVWNSHDMLDLSGESVTFAASDAPISEMKNQMVGKPVERDEVYTVAGDTLNSLVGMAQRVTGSQEPMTPDQAADALEEFYAQPTAEELRF